MKKIMSLMLGLTLIVGATTAFAADDKADKTSTEKKGKKKGAKKTDATTKSDTTK